MPQIQFWSASEDETLTRLWHEGLSFSKMTDVLVNRTKNMCIGRANRLGLLGKPRVKPIIPKTIIHKGGLTPAEEAILTRLANEGATTLAITASMPGRSAYSIIHHRRQLKLPNPARRGLKPVRPTMPMDQVADSVLSKHIMAIFEPHPEVEDVVSYAAEAIWGLKFGDCRFPIGDPLKDNFRFCDRRAVIGKAYCPECHNISFGLGTPSERRATKGMEASE
jgi:GcrA cell cycle regulator